MTCEEISSELAPLLEKRANFDPTDVNAFIALVDEALETTTAIRETLTETELGLIQVFSQNLDMQMANFMRSDKSPYIAELTGQLNKIFAKLETVTTEVNPIEGLEKIDIQLNLLRESPGDTQDDLDDRIDYLWDRATESRCNINKEGILWVYMTCEEISSELAPLIVEYNNLPADYTQTLATFGELIKSAMDETESVRQIM